MNEEVLAIKLKYLALLRQEARKLFDDTGPLIKAATSKREEYKIMARYDEKLRKLYARINKSGLAEIEELRRMQ